MLGRKQEGKNLTLELRELKGLEGSSEMNRNRRDLTRRFRPKQFLLTYEAVCLSPPFWGGALAMPCARMPGSAPLLAAGKNARHGRFGHAAHFLFGGLASNGLLRFCGAYCARAIISLATL